jgi:hypothetical protein
MRNTLLLGAAGLAAALATATAGPAARAQAFMPGEAQAQAGNLAGGGGATISGGGDDMVITYSAGGAGGGGAFAQGGRLARFTGTDGDGLQVEYSAPVPPAVPGAGTGREAWLIGGGDNTLVVYASPR